MIYDMAMVDFKEGKSIKCGRNKRRTYFCGIIDDSSRFLVGHEWGVNEDTALFARTLKKAIATYGIPKILYDLVENANPPYVATSYSKLFTK